MARFTGRGGEVLCLTYAPHNAEIRPSPSRHYPHRGLSHETSSMIMRNQDTWMRLLREFDRYSDVALLRSCNKTIRDMIDDHPQLWKEVQFSPPGLARLSRQEVALAGEKWLRKGAEEGNVEAAMMLALLYHHGYRCPCHPMMLPKSIFSA